MPHRLDMTSAPSAAHWPKNHRAFSAVELIVSCAILSAVVAMTAVVLGNVTAMRRDLAQHVLAEQALLNVVEQIESLDFDAVTNERLAVIQLDTDTARWLSTAQLTFDIDDMTMASWPQRRIIVTLQWHGMANRPANFVQTTLYRAAARSPMEITPVPADKELPDA